MNYSSIDLSDLQRLYHMEGANYELATEVWDMMDLIYQTQGEIVLVGLMADALAGSGEWADDDDHAEWWLHQIGNYTGIFGLTDGVPKMPRRPDFDYSQWEDYEEGVSSLSERWLNTRLSRVRENNSAADRMAAAFEKACEEGLIPEKNRIYD